MVRISNAVSSLSRFVALLCAFAVFPAKATDELFIQVLSAGIPVSDAGIVVDGVMLVKYLPAFALRVFQLLHALQHQLLLVVRLLLVFLVFWDEDHT